MLAQEWLCSIFAQVFPKHHRDASGGEMAMWLETHENSDLALPFAGCIVE
jgi:hypothetical protein